MVRKANNAFILIEYACLIKCNPAVSARVHDPVGDVYSHVVRLCVAGAVEVRKEGLDSQINRLAELIGRLENKVRSSTHTHTHTHTHVHALFTCEGILSAQH